MTKTELKQNITKIKKFLKQRDYESIDMGIELARALDEPAVFEALLGGWSINDEGKLVLEEGYQGETLIKRWTNQSWQYFEYALWNLIGYASKSTKLDKSLKQASIHFLGLKNVEWVMVIERQQVRASNNIMSLVVTESNWDLENLDTLANCNNIINIVLQGCKDLKDIHAIANCKQLTKLDISYAQTLQNIEGLNACTKITNLNLSNCWDIQNINALTNLTSLTVLDLSDCHDIQNINALSNCSNLIKLSLRNCKSLKNIDGLANCTKLTNLDLRGCDSIQNIDGLENLTNLITLDLSSCDALQNIDGLKNLMNITTLNLEFCDFLQNINGLAELASLTNLGLYSCKSIENVNGLENLTNLITLDLSSCDALQNIDGLTELPNLSSLDLGDCVSLRDVYVSANQPTKMSTRTEISLYQEKLSIMIALNNNDTKKLKKYKNKTSIDLSFCTGLINIDGLLSFDKLSNLNLSKCPNIEPKPSPVHMTSRAQVVVFQIKIMKKAKVKIPQSFIEIASSIKKEKKQLTPQQKKFKPSITKINKLIKSGNLEAGIELIKTLNNSEITEGVLKSVKSKVMKFLRQRDYTAIDKGIELVRTLNKSIIFESLLEGCSIDANGKIIRNKAFTGTGPAQPYLDIALLGLIRSAHSLSKLDESLILSNIKINEFQKSNFDMLKMKLETMLKHSIPIKEIDKIKLIIEDSWGGHLSGHDGIEECLKGVGYTILDSPFYGPGYAIAFGNDFLLFDNSSNVGNTPYGVEGSFEFKNSPMGGNMCVYIKKIITEDDVREYLLSLGFNN